MSKNDQEKSGKHISNSKNVVDGSHIEGQNIHIGDIIYSGNHNEQSEGHQQNAAQVRELLGRGKTLKALEALQQQLQQKGDQSLIDEAVLLGSRLANLQREQRMGLISFSDAGIQSAQINHAILTLANEV